MLYSLVILEEKRQVREEESQKWVRAVKPTRRSEK